MRDRLIELLCSVECIGEEPCAYKAGQRCSTIQRLGLCSLYTIADHLLANGVIVPPCKVGDKVYQTDGVRIYESTIYEITITNRNKIFCTEKVVFDEDAIGTSIFLTPAAIEKALAERSGGNERF